MKPLHEMAARLAGFDADALPVHAVQAAIDACLDPINDRETVPLAQALGRVLAQDLISPIDVPAHDNSAMDGYAFAHGFSASGPARLRIVGAALAGHPYPTRVPAGACVRIMTGAVLPNGCDTVVPQELCTVHDDTLWFPADAVRAAEHCRPRGEDLARGAAALQAGRHLTPADLGLAASLGVESLLVMRRLRVAYFSTGDEVCAPGTPLRPGAIYDANGASVRAMLERLGVTPIDLGIVGDDPARLEAALHDASLYADAVVTSGGVGLGDADHTRVLLARLGDVVAWNLAIRPGRPMVFGQLHRPAADATRLSCALFGLPGNPVAAMVSFYVFVRPALLRLQGAQARPLPRLRVRCTERLRKRAGRTEFQRGILHTDSAGEPAVRSTGPQGSGVLRSMTQANCLIVLPDAQGDVAAGDWVEVMLFEGLV